MIKTVTKGLSNTVPMVIRARIFSPLEYEILLREDRKIVPRNELFLQFQLVSSLFFHQKATFRRSLLVNDFKNSKLLTCDQEATGRKK